MRSVIIKVLLWIVIVNLFGFVAMNRLNLTPDTAYQWIRPDHFPVTQSWDFVDMHNRWDTYWYLDIVAHGYYLKTDNTLSNVVFFPLYPALIKGVGTLLLGHFVLAGWLLSCLFLLIGCGYFYRFMQKFHPNLDPELPIMLMLVFPTAFFLNIVYTEALFFCLTIMTFYYTLERRFWTAAGVAFLGALTHSNGVFLALPIFWEIVRLHGWKAIFSRWFWAMASAPIASFLFIGYDYWKFKNPLLFFQIESAWGRAFVFNKEHFSFFSHPSIVNMGIDIAFTILIITALVLIFRNLSRLYAVFMSLTVLSALSSGTLMSIGRYSLVLFPLFIWLSTIKNKTALQAWIFGSSLFLALDILLFTTNYWAG